MARTSASASSRRLAVAAPSALDLGLGRLWVAPRQIRQEADPEVRDLLVSSPCFLEDGLARKAREELCPLLERDAIPLRRPQPIDERGVQVRQLRVLQQPERSSREREARAPGASNLRQDEDFGTIVVDLDQAL
jgi:hypothetical protein